jgi:hypothetical protein
MRHMNFVNSRLRDAAPISADRSPAFTIGPEVEELGCIHVIHSSTHYLWQVLIHAACACHQHRFRSSCAVPVSMYCGKTLVAIRIAETTTTECFLELRPPWRITSSASGAEDGRRTSRRLDLVCQHGITTSPPRR